MLLIVFAPVIVGVLAFAALLLGAATTGAWDAVAERGQRRPTASGSADSQVAMHEETRARAA
jgi:hypothetical protein